MEKISNILQIIKKEVKNKPEFWFFLGLTVLIIIAGYLFESMQI